MFPLGAVPGLTYTWPRSLTPTGASVVLMHMNPKPHAGPPALLKMPWIDRQKCKKESGCPASKKCEQGAFRVRGGSDEETGRTGDFPLIDLELCKRCGDCEHACPEGAVKMI